MRASFKVTWGNIFRNADDELKLKLKNVLDKKASFISFCIMNNWKWARLVVQECVGEGMLEEDDMAFLFQYIPEPEPEPDPETEPIPE